MSTGFRAALPFSASTANSAESFLKQISALIGCGIQLSALLGLKPLDLEHFTHTHTLCLQSGLMI